METFKSKIQKLDLLKSIGKFIDLLTFYHYLNAFLKTVATADLLIE